MVSNFSKKHYIQIAELLKGEIKPNLNQIEMSLFNRIVSSFGLLFKIDNSRFDSEKFYRAIYK